MGYLLGLKAWLKLKLKILWPCYYLKLWFLVKYKMQGSDISKTPINTHVFFNFFNLSCQKWKLSLTTTNSFVPFLEMMSQMKLLLSSNKKMKIHFQSKTVIASAAHSLLGRNNLSYALGKKKRQMNAMNAITSLGRCSLINWAKALWSLGWQITPWTYRTISHFITTSSFL